MIFERHCNILDPKLVRHMARIVDMFYSLFGKDFFNNKFSTKQSDERDRQFNAQQAAELEDRLTEALGKVQRDTRRINLASGQQTEKLLGIAGVVESLQCELAKLNARLERDTDIQLAEEQLLQVLDALDSLATLLRFNKALSKRVEDIRAQLILIAEWKTVVEIGEPYHPQYSNVAAIVTPETNEQCRSFESGSVFDIIRQGYLRHNGDLVREASVVAVTNAGKRAVASGDGEEDQDR